MPISKSPRRIDADVTASAEDVAPRMGRTVSQQIAHWARIGRELERSPGVSVRDVSRVLEGSADFDALGPKEQAIVRATWSERMEELRKGLRLDTVLAKRGAPYAELDDDGDVVVRGRTRDGPGPGSGTG